MDYRVEQLFQEETIDIKKYLFKIFLNWYWFVLAVFISMSIAYYINRFSEPVYNVGGSTVIVRHERMRSAGMEAFLGDIGLLNDRTTIQNQMEILRSFSLNRRVMDELDFDITYVALGRFKNAQLYQTADIKVNYSKAHVQRTDYPVYVTILSKHEYHLQINENIGVDRIMSFGEQFEHELFNFNITLQKLDYTHEKYYFRINDGDALANRYRSKLQISLNNPETGSVLFLSSSGKVARQEADYLNKLMEMFIRLDLEEKNQTAVNTIEFIDEQLIEIVDSLQQVETALQDFQNLNSVTNLSREGNIIFSQIEKSQSEKVELSIKSKYFNYLDEYLSDRSTNEDIIAPSAIGIGDPLLNSLIGQLNQLYSDRNVLEFNVQENNPRISQIDQIIQNVSETLQENVRSMISANNLAIEDVNNRLQLAEAELSKLPRIERQMFHMERRFNLSNNLYTYLMEKRAEASIAKAASISDIRILDYARTSQVSLISPKVKRNYSFAFIFGLGIPFMLIIIAGFLKTKIPDKAYLEKNTNVPLLGSIGHNLLKSEIPVEENPKSAIAESFRGLRTNLQYLLRKTGAKTISITSTVSGEGKTFSAINLATIIAMSGKKTLLVGLDLRKPRINSLFGYDSEVGLSTYLIGKYNEDEIIEKSDINNLDVITSGPIPPNPAELLQSDKMAEFLKEIKNRYDYIIFDTPPVAIVSDALIVNRYADITIFVVRQNYSNKNVLEFINELYNKKEINNLSILLNDVKTSGYYGYNYNNYGYGYGYNHGYYGEEEKQSFFSLVKKILKI
ncbi:MAG: polysaccharide biosynthesis tyrosine autokinase [Bacteroidales bacterium]